MSKPEEPLRGEAAWRAEKKAIAARNEAAYARGRTERAAVLRESAEAQIRGTLALDPNYPHAILNLGLIHMARSSALAACRRSPCSS